MGLKLRDGETILFIGDSITDCGRREDARGVGDGYVRLFADRVTVREPEKKVSVINTGISGDTVVGLRRRWVEDALSHHPDWLSIKIGINDLHTHLAGDPEGVSLKMYREAYGDILSRTRKALPKCQILLITPFYICKPETKDAFRQSVMAILPRYLDVVFDMQKTYQTRLVNTHEMFQRLIQYHEPDLFCPEPVHPNLTGHLAIAEAVYDCLSA